MDPNLNNVKSELEAKKYIEHHSLDKVMAEMLNTLIAEKTSRPEIFMIKYLSSLLSKEEQIKNGIHTPDSTVTSFPIVKFPSHIMNSYLNKYLTNHVWNLLKYKKTKYRANINDILKDPTYGVSLTDEDCLKTFRDIFEPIIREVNELQTLGEIPRSNTHHFDLKDVDKSLIQSVRLEYERNIQGFPFPNHFTVKGREEIEKNILLAINHYQKNTVLSSGDVIYHSKNQEKFNEIIDKNGIDMVPRDDSVLFTTDDRSIIIIINDHSHLRIISTHNNDINECYSKLVNITNNLDEILNFVHDPHYGYLNQSVRKLGSSLYFYCELTIKGLEVNKRVNYEEIMKFFELKKEGDGVVSFAYQQLLSQTENEFLEFINNRIFNLNFLESSEKAEVEHAELDKVESEHLIKAYTETYNLYKWSHYPENITINSVLFDSVNNKNNTLYFRYFPVFYQKYIMSSRHLNELHIHPDQSIRHNLEDYSELSNLSQTDFIKVKNIHIKIRRNIRGYNFPAYLAEGEKAELDKILSDNVSFVSSLGNYKYEETTNTYSSNDGKIKIILNQNDHLTFEFYHEDPDFTVLKVSEFLDLLKSFFTAFKEINSKLEYNHYYYATDPLLGYLTNDNNYIGTGLTFNSELLKEEVDYDQEKLLDEKIGFDLLNNPDSMTITCSLSIDSSINKMFEFFGNFMRSLKKLDVKPEIAEIEKEEDITVI